MDQSSSLPAGKWYGPIVLCGSALAACLLVKLVGCGSFNPVGISSPATQGNAPPSIAVLEPNADRSISKGEDFIVRWTDNDPDDNAMISIDLVQVDGSRVVQLAGNIRENDVTPDTFRASTADVVLGTYFLRLTISDGVNPPVAAFAQTTGDTDEQEGVRIQIAIVPEGLGTPNSPPRVFVANPQITLGVSQNDTFNISVRPSLQQFPPDQDPGPALHYDMEGAVELVVMLDLDEDPGNDDPFDEDGNNDFGNIIFLERRTIPENSWAQEEFPITVDVADIPVRADGLPYLVRASIDDGLTTTHSYATGRLFVLELVQGSASEQRRVVDLGQVGTRLAGARFQGFSPRGNLGSKMTSALDMDNDGVGDFVVVAQFGNPRNLGNIGELYLIYGAAGRRFGGILNINSVAPEFPASSRNRIRGAVMHPAGDAIYRAGIDLDLGDDLRIKQGGRSLNEPYTMGITDVVPIGNLGGTNAPLVGACGVPELLIGMPHHEYWNSTRDDDIADNPDEGGCSYCYPDNLPNNYCDDDEPDDPSPNFGNIINVYGNNWAAEEKRGGVSLWFGENALAGTSDPQDVCNNLIAPLPQVYSLTECGNQASDDSQVEFGANFSVAIFDGFGYENPELSLDNTGVVINPLNSHFGMNVGVLPDLNLDGVDELIMSSPRNELEVVELLASAAGENHPHLTSRLARGNIIVFLGWDFSNITVSEDNSSHIPFMTAAARLRSSCNSNNPAPRSLETAIDNNISPSGVNASPPGYFRIQGESPDDKLGGGRSAGDFNLDGPADILCGAPFNDPLIDTDFNGLPDSRVRDAGTVYIIYTRLPIGDVQLIEANFPNFRPPMLRIFGESEMDHIGLKQELGTDVNGDGIDDVFIGSADYNGQGLVDNGFVGIVFGGQRIDGDRNVSQIATTELAGTRFYGSESGHRAGADVSSAGDFNRDGFGDLLISVPGELVDHDGNPATPERVGAAYLIFGGLHLHNKVFSLSQVGTTALPGIVFAGPYESGTIDTQELEREVFVRDSDCDPWNEAGELVNFECLCDPEIEEACDRLLDATGNVDLRTITDAAPSRVGFVGDINADGFDDIMIGNPTADVVDPSLPAQARRPDAGEAYLVYGNSFGANQTRAGGTSGQ